MTVGLRFLFLVAAFFVRVFREMADGGILTVYFKQHFFRGIARCSHVLINAG